MRSDIIIVGGGSAGCVLANRLSEIPSRRVILIEAGPDDRDLPVGPLIRMPKGIARVLTNPKYAYYHPTDIHELDAGLTPEFMMGGKVLGGSSSVNGMVYHRGQPQDYDRWAEMGNAGWSWSDVLPYFKKLEDHELPPAEWRGRGGPLSLTMAARTTRLAEALIGSANTLGVRRKAEPNLCDHRGISYIASNIDSQGRRVSAARAFLPPKVRRRANLHIVTNARVDRIMFENRRAVGIVATQIGGQVQYYADLEVIVCAGALQSPAILQRSGVGSAETLKNLGIEVVKDSVGVGRNLHDHWNYYTAYTLKHQRDSQNREFRGWRLTRNLARYALMGTGPMADGLYELSAFLETEQGKGRADVGLLFAAYSLEQKPTSGGFEAARDATMHFYGFPLRPTSEGSVTIRSPDPATPAVISPNYLSTDHDRRLVLNVARFIRRLVAHPALRDLVACERAPTAGARTDDEILDIARRFGTSGLHAGGTCKMGPDDDTGAVLDTHLRVRGVSGLRVVDCSFFPELISANTNGPMMALAWRASDLILGDMAS